MSIETEFEAERGAGDTTLQDGYAAGVAWALDDATFQQLRRLSDALRGLPVGNTVRNAPLAFRAVIDTSCGGLPAVVDLPADELAEATFWVGFAAGAMHCFEGEQD